MDGTHPRTRLHQIPDQVYRTDRWSQYQWQRYLDGSPRAKAVIERGEQKVYSFPRFGRELFHRLYGDKAVRVESPRPEGRWAQRAHEELEAMPEFERLRRRCRGDRLLAGTAAVAFSEMLIEKLPEAPAKLEDPEPLREQVRGLVRFARDLDERGEDTSEIENLVQNLRQDGRKAVAAATGFSDAVDDSELRQALRGACQAGDESVSETISQVDAFCGWGMGSTAGSADVGLEAKAQVASHVARSSKLQALAREAGRLRRIAAQKQRSKAKHARDEVTDIERGNDLARLLPSELVRLVDPRRSLPFAKDYLERGLLQYRLSGKEPQGKGPIVVCIDQSSSMEGAKEIWSKAIALALLQIATMQKRSCRVIHFNGSVVRADDWRPGHVDPMALMHSMEPFYGGGTNFEPALASALEAISTESHLRQADVVIVTDGEAHLSNASAETWTQAKKRHEFTCYAVHVDSLGGVPPEQLSAIADQVVGLADVADDQVATDTLLTI